jgi:uncharacterized protein
MKRYHDLDTELKNTFGRKVFKLSLSGGFTCPNRSDGSGCIFCSGSGSGEFAASPALGIKEQAAQQASLLSKKWKSGAYIAYFGNFTSTYADTERLDKIYGEAISQDGVLGLAIATRPDCISDDVLSLLEEYNKKTYLWVELGLQTIHDRTHGLLNTGYTVKTFYETYKRLEGKNIRSVPHLIFSLPGESDDMMLESVRFISSLKPWGIKFHMLFILYTSALYKMYLEKPFRIISQDEYVSLITDALEMLDKDITVHRLTGDPPRKDLYMPLWTVNKREVLQSVEKNLIMRGSYQGIRSVIGYQ